MLILEPSFDYLKEVAKICDLCLKPCRHSVINVFANKDQNPNDEYFDLTLRIECRDMNGKRLKENDLEIEIYSSGVDLSITLSWLFYPDRPILWYGKHSVWMDSITGMQSNMPIDGSPLEALARRLRSFFLMEEAD